MVILVLNCGSSSIKYQVIDICDGAHTLLAKGIVERIGLAESDLVHKPVGKEVFKLHQPIADHTTGIRLVLEALTNPEHGVISSLEEVKAVYAAEDVNTIDGVKISFEAKKEWVHLRRSNTEPIIRIYAEAATAEAADALAQQIIAIANKIIG